MSRETDDAYAHTVWVEQEQEIKDIADSFKKVLKKRDMTDKEVVNDIFEHMMEEYPKKLFEIVYVMSDESDLRPDQTFKMLDTENRSKLKNYAMNFYNTSYYEKKEIEKRKRKMEKLGKSFDIRNNLEDLFE